MKPNRSTRRVVLGICLIIFGILWAVSQIFPESFNLMFDGWWTLFIIVPSLCGLFTDKDITGSIFGLAVGVMLLLQQQCLIDWHLFGHLVLAALVIALGLKLIIGRRSFPKGNRETEVAAHQIIRDGKNIRTYEVTFGEQKVSLDNEVFEGADVECSFGAFRLDLTHALISQDVVVRVHCSFGGATILVPENCGVKIAAKSAFGGIDDKRTRKPENPEHTIYIDGEVSFAGLEIR